MIVNNLQGLSVTTKIIVDKLYQDRLETLSSVNDFVDEVVSILEALWLITINWTIKIANGYRDAYRSLLKLTS